jgi:hypothetical protein
MSGARALGSGRSLGRGSPPRNFHVPQKSREVGGGTVGESHLGNTGASESSCDCSSAPLSASPGCTACWDTGGLKCHLSPPSRMSRGWGGWGEGWEEREEAGPWAEPAPGAGLPCCHLASWGFFLLQAPDFFLLCPLTCDPHLAP